MKPKNPTIETEKRDAAIWEVIDSLVDDIGRKLLEFGDGLRLIGKNITALLEEVNRLIERNAFLERQVAEIACKVESFSFSTDFRTSRGSGGILQRLFVLKYRLTANVNSSGHVPEKGVAIQSGIMQYVAPMAADMTIGSVPQRPYLLRRVRLPHDK